ncbi:MAG: putative lipid II flippase FtsW [Oscillospiraceae bacterium]|nr:putative lipid II flippase FtsW [Oscillospiraceae bacterium]MDD4547116.1 putative lipid II flippase FtsW [Oscillospiraceae bacterium]
MASTSANTVKSKQKRIRIFSVAQGFDMPFLIILMLILVVGLVTLFSAGYAYSYYWNGGDSFYYIKRQLVFALLGIFAMFVVSTVDYHILHHFAIPLMVVSYILLGVVLLLPATKGVHRWIRLPGFQFQPSEIAKFALILLFSHLISINHKKMKTFTAGFMPFILILGITCGLVFIEPHLSGAILIMSIGVVMMYIGGTRLIYLLGTFGMGFVAIFYMVIIKGYEKDRINVWLDPIKAYVSNSDKAWQTIQSLFAIGSGGLMGQGLGNSRQKHLFLPEPHNDFIFSVICEELGFIGAILVIVLFALLIWRGITIGMKSPDKFGSMLAIGLTVQVGVQAILNIAVVTNSIPNTGISLPFFSYGGTSLVMLLAQMGVVLAVSRNTVTGESYTNIRQKH